MIRQAGQPKKIVQNLPLTWTPRAGLCGTANINKIFYGNGMFVGTDGTNVYTTADPTVAWTLSTHTLPYSCYSIWHGSDGYWVGGCGSGKIIYTNDPTAAWSSTTAGTQALQDVCHDGTYWVVAGGAGVLYSATTPSGTWTSRTS